ncbi:hypothetical protein DVB87_14560 [Tsukamurella tyrosinosolvens]|nr:hypothetical protein DVB87_14560 [Tsukamurella tyrosinosolvens]
MFEKQLSEQVTTNDLVRMAQYVTEKLGEEFDRWIEKTFDSLKPGNPELIQAINNLNIPIATTNYDDLIEQVTGRAYVTLHDSRVVHRALFLAPGRYVIHLHGVWLKPETVVLSALDYGKLLGNDTSQALEKAAVISKSFVFIGAAGTLDDPNISSMLDALPSLIATPTSSHFVLCRTEEVETLRGRYPGGWVQFVPYGDQYEDLPKFVRRLSSFRIESASPAEQIEFLRNGSLERIIEGAVDRSLIPAVADRIGAGAAVSDLLIPPVLLTIHHDELAARIGEETPKEARERVRVKTADMTLGDRIIVVVGDDTTGKTSALQWILCERTEADTIPVLLNFGHIGKLSRGIEREVVNYLGVGQGGVVENIRDAIVMGVDDVVPSSTKKFRSFMDEIAESWASRTVLSCSLASEADLIDALRSRGLDFELRYLGRVTTSDILKMTELFFDRPDRQKADRIRAAIRFHRLAETPFSAALMMNLPTTSVQSVAFESMGNLLREFVRSLIEAHDAKPDSSSPLDARARQLLLAGLAERMCRNVAGSVSEATAITLFDSQLSGWGWQESALDVLVDLTQRRLLTRRNGQVSFNQTSYLYHFAALRARENNDFLKYLRSRDLLFSPVLSNYVSQVRNDESMLRAVSEMCDTHQNGSTTAKIFSRTVPAEVPDDSIPESLLMLLEHTEDPDGGGTRDSEDAGDASPPNEVEPATTEPDVDAEYVLDHAGRIESDPAPFPEIDLESASEATKIFEILKLASNVIRDSDMVGDMELRLEALSRVMRLWADAVLALEQDDDFAQVREVVLESFAKQFGSDSADYKKIARYLRIHLHHQVVMYGMFANLSSSRLIVSIEKLMESGAVEDAEYAMLAQLALHSGSSQWPVYFTHVAKDLQLKELTAGWMLTAAHENYVQNRKLNRMQTSQIEEFTREVVRLHTSDERRRANMNAEKMIDGLRKKRLVDEQIQNRSSTRRRLG